MRTEATEYPYGRNAGVAELVDATGLGPVERKLLEVRVLSPASVLAAAGRDAGRMGRAVKTTVEELPENRVRLAVEVSEHDVAHAFEHAATDLAANTRIPGFRPGHAPLAVVTARIGRDAVWDEAVRGHLDGWFWNAADEAGIQAVSAPEVELGEMPGEGEPFQFTATVAVSEQARRGRVDGSRGAEGRGRGSPGDRRRRARGAAPHRGRARPGRPSGAGRRHGRRRPRGRAGRDAARLRDRGGERPADRRARRRASRHGRRRGEDGRRSRCPTRRPRTSS